MNPNRNTIAYKQGAKAFAERCTAKANPYGFETLSWWIWKDGFDDAKVQAEADEDRRRQIAEEDRSNFDRGE